MAPTSRPNDFLAMNSAARIASIGKKFNIFTSVRPAEWVEALVTDNAAKNLPLSSTVCAIKDNIATTQEPTTCGSAILQDYVSPFESTVTRLLAAAGSTIVGKTNLDEFGMGDATSHSFIGPTFNPAYPSEKYVPGGSSGGSAAALAAGLCDFALGTDTGGSVRLPAAFCGVIGFKPSYGRLSRWGVVAYAQSLDTVGIFAKNMDVLRKVYSVLDVRDTKDPTSLSQELRDRCTTYKATPVTNVGISKEYLVGGLTPETITAVKQVLQSLLESHSIMPFDLPTLPYSLPSYFTVALSEAASNLSRYDGIRYGYMKPGTDFASTIENTRSTGFGEEVQKRILVGNHNLSSEKFHNNFLKAQEVRTKLRGEFNTVFKLPNILTDNSQAVDSSKLDFIIAPVASSPAIKVSDYVERQTSNPASSYINDALVIPSSLTGLPSISIPWKIKPSTVPIGIQIIGQYGDDQRLLEFAKKLLSKNQ